MEVILIKEVFHLGHAGDVVKVREGYARNYLLPQNIAVRKTKTSLKILEKEKAKLEAQRKERTEHYEGLLRALEGLGACVIKVKTSTEGKMYGSISNQHIAAVLSEGYDLNIPKKHIRLGDPIKALGEHSVPIVLNKDHKIGLKVLVESDSEPKKAKEPTSEEAVVPSVDDAETAEAPEPAASATPETAVEPVEPIEEVESVKEAEEADKIDEVVADDDAPQSEAP